METELKIINLAFRPLSDEGDEEDDMDKEDLGEGGVADQGEDSGTPGEDDGVEIAEE